MKPRRQIGNLNIVGPRMIKQRNNLGLTQRELLARLQTNGLDISAATLSEIERQVRMVRDYELPVIASSLQMSLEELLL